MNRILSFLLLAISCVLGSGCVTACKSEVMTVPASAFSSLAPKEALRNNISVSRIEGGTKTNPLLMSEIDSGGFKTALEESLRNARLLSPGGGLSRYIVNAAIIHVDQPTAGMDFTIAMSVRYVVLEPKAETVLFDEVINESYTARMSESPIAGLRLRKAKEGAARANILRFIQQLNTHAQIPQK